MNDPRAELAAWRDPALRRPESFLARAEVLDRLDFLAASPLAPAVAAEVDDLRTALEAAGAALFGTLRARVRAGLRGPALREILDSLVSSSARLPPDAPGYDALDVLADDLLFPGFSDDAPAPSLALTPDMVGLQQAPARVILALADEVERTSASAFHDIGAGWGRVALLLGLLTGIPARGIERDPALCGYARACAEDLRATNVSFIACDARAADYHGGPDDVYFLYTPLRGGLLQETLDRLRAQAAPGARVFTYGPCSFEAARHAGLQRVNDGAITPDRLEVFHRTGD